MSRLLFDIEGNNLLWKVTKLWCIATEDIDTGQQMFYPPNDLEKGIEALRGADVLSGHNIIGYDLPAIWKVFGDWDTFPLITDTLVLSRGLLPERKGGHSLDAWGESLGFKKAVFDKEQFKIGYTEEMGQYCLRDVAVNRKVYTELGKEMEAQYGTALQGYKVYS